MLSIRSTMMFLKVPEEVSFTYPRGTRASLSQQALRTAASTEKVALWDREVEKEWQASAPRKDRAMSTALTP